MVGEVYEDGSTVSSYDITKYTLPPKSWRTEVWKPAAKHLSLRFSEYSEVGTYDTSEAEIKTSLKIESPVLDSPVVFRFCNKHVNKKLFQNHDKDLPGTVSNPESFEMPGASSCTIVYDCEGLTWDKDPAVPTKKGFHWGWRCLVTATFDAESITDFDLASLISLCPNLHPNNLKHFGKGPQFCQALAVHREELNDLDLRYCSAITDAALACLPAGCLELHPDRLLSGVKGDKYLTSVGQQHLDIDSIDFKACPKATDRGKLAVLAGCPKIVVDATVFEVMNDEVLVTLGKLRPRQSSEFDLLRFKKVTDKGLAGLVRSCPAVHPNDIKSLAKGDQFLAAVTDQHTRLRKINLLRCNQVTDQALAELVTRCPNLVPDAIKSLQKGDLFVAAVAKYRPKLKHIDLSGCTMVTEDGLVLLIKGCPQLDPGDIRSTRKGVCALNKRLCLSC